MGPRFCKRGNGRAKQPQLLRPHQLQWGHAFVSVETKFANTHAKALGDASMGPRFCKRGNPTPSPATSPPHLTLQWGHAFVSVETACCAYAGAGRAASMGPRFCKRGNVACRSQLVLSAIASMGPRFCKRGNALVAFSALPWTKGLQWGHAFVSVETAAAQDG